MDKPRLGKKKHQKCAFFQHLPCSGGSDTHGWTQQLDEKERQNPLTILKLVSPIKQSIFNNRVDYQRYYITYISPSEPVRTKINNSPFSHRP